MSSEWYEVSLGEFAEINPRRTISKGACAKFIDMAALPIYGRDINNKDIALREFTSGGAKFRNGDTLLARITPCLENGKTAFVSCLNRGEFAFGSTEFIVLGPKSVDDSLFLYYLARSEEFRTYAISRMEGTSGRQRVPNSAVAEYRFLCPPPTVRSEIGRILGGIDDRIALLRETNGTLEAIAQALFKSWFVDFDPVHANAGTQAPSLPPEIQALFPATFTDSPQGPIPEGWSWKTLDEAYEINPKRLLKKGVLAKYLDMASVQTRGHVTEEVIDREFGSGTKFCNGDTLLARITPCLENGKTAFVDFLGPNETGWGSTEFVVLKPKAPLPDFHGYLLARQSVFREFAIRSMSGTSGRQRVQNDVLGSFNLAMPDEPIATAFSQVVTPIQQSISANHKQAKTLANLRDSLLPRLISGQLKLPEVTVSTAEVN
jgi:type I restriction enzyme S subunit